MSIEGAGFDAALCQVHDRAIERWENEGGSFAGLHQHRAPLVTVYVDRRHLPEGARWRSHRLDGSTQLVTDIGVYRSTTGCVLTDAHQQTSTPGLFAAGDVVEGLDQIAVATGQAARAATAIHNLLREREQG